MKTGICKAVGHLLLMTIPVWMAMGCDSRTEPDMPAGDGTLDLVLRVSVATPEGDATRADAPDAFEGPEYTWENLLSMRIIIVEEPPVQTFAPGTPVDETAPDKIVYNRYLSSYSLADDTGQAMRFKVKLATDYRIYLIGNERGLKDLVEDAETLLEKTLAAGKNYDGQLENLTLDIPGGAGQPLIDNSEEGDVPVPMSEYFRVRTVDNGEADQEVKLFITRAASKFSFEVKTAEESEGNEYGFSVPLTSFTLSGVAGKEYLLPRDAVYVPQKENGGSQTSGNRWISSFNVPDGVPTADFRFHFPGSGLSFTAAGQVKRYSPVIYLPESPLTPFEPGVKESGWKCTLGFADGSMLEAPVSLTNLPGGLARNTHVKVVITLGSRMMPLTVEVMPWNTVKSYLDYTDHISMADEGALAFELADSEALDKTTGTLTATFGETAKGTFTISTPEGLKWDAYLLSTEGIPEAIQFKDPVTGVMSAHCSGITGKQSSIYITAAYPESNVESSARLQVVVTLEDGRRIPVNVLHGGGYGKDVDFLTIVQNQL